MTAPTDATITARITVAEWLVIHVARKYGSQDVCAAALGLSRATVCSSLTGKHAPNKRLLADAGVKLLQQQVVVVDSEGAPR